MRRQSVRAAALALAGLSARLVQELRGSPGLAFVATDAEEAEEDAGEPAHAEPADAEPVGAWAASPPHRFCDDPNGIGSYMGMGKSLSECQALCDSDPRCWAVYGGFDGDGPCWLFPAGCVETTHTSEYTVHYRPAEAAGQPYVQGTMLAEGEVISITAPDSSFWWNVDLKDDDGLVLFHFNARHSHIVRNAWDGKWWGKDETGGGWPFRDKEVDMHIVSADGVFQIYVDGVRSPEFDFRKRLGREVTQVEVKGLQDPRILVVTELGQAPPAAEAAELPPLEEPPTEVEEQQPEAEAEDDGEEAAAAEEQGPQLEEEAPAQADDEAPASPPDPPEAKEASRETDEERGPWVGLPAGEEQHPTALAVAQAAEAAERHAAEQIGNPDFGDPDLQEYRRRFLRVVNSFFVWPPAGKRWVASTIASKGPEKGIRSIIRTVADDHTGILGMAHLSDADKEAIAASLTSDEEFMQVAKKNFVGAEA